jgi:protein involved in polysaccharide export with SLBB domain
MLRSNLVRFALVLCLMGLVPVLLRSQQSNTVVPAATRVGSDNSSRTGTQSEVSSGLQSRNPRYQLHSADVLELTFAFSPEFNQTVTVQPDGYITLRGVDGIRVEGQTLPQAVASLRIAYSKILREPEINVELKDFEKPYFIVGGEVGHPGKFDLRDETTVAEAVAVAGGLRETSKHSDVLLFHRVPDGWSEVKKVNLKKLLKQADLNEDAYLQPGDFIYVPQNAFSKFERFLPTSSLGLYANPASLP